MTHHRRKPIVIAGPCAAETPEQIRFTLTEAHLRDVDYVRVSLWKPRTKPGFDGLKELGIPLLVDAARMGLSPATEVLMPEHAEAVMAAVLPELKDNHLMLWIGARNQNHQVQQEIAHIASQDARVWLMVKNQPWACANHWEGIVDHVLAGGINPDNVILCHRGFTGANSAGLRNVPDSEMAMRIRSQSGLSMVLDLSHTAGHADKVADMAEEATNFEYDGILVEVHPTPRFAWTDAKQQITWSQFDEIQARLCLAESLQAKVMQA